MWLTRTIQQWLIWHGDRLRVLTSLTYNSMWPPAFTNCWVGPKHLQSLLPQLQLQPQKLPGCWKHSSPRLAPVHPHARKLSSETQCRLGRKPNSEHWFTTSFLQPLVIGTDYAICLEIIQLTDWFSFSGVQMAVSLWKTDQKKQQPKLTTTKNHLTDWFSFRGVQMAVSLWQTKKKKNKKKKKIT